MDKSKIISIVQIIAEVIFIIAAVSICIKFRRGGVSSLVAFLEKNTAVAVISVLVLYIMKSFIVILPVSLLCVAVSIVFSPVEAVSINFIGYLLELTAGYIIGGFVGRDAADNKLANKKFVKDFINKIGNSKTSSVLLIRFLPFFPNDVMSLFFGGSKTDIKKYFAGSIFGFLPWLFTYSVVGGIIDTPFQRRLIAMSVFLAWIFTAMVYFYLRHKYD